MAEHLWIADEVLLLIALLVFVDKDTNGGQGSYYDARREAGCNEHVFGG